MPPSRHLTLRPTEEMCSKLRYQNMGANKQKDQTKQTQKHFPTFE